MSKIGLRTLKKELKEYKRRDLIDLITKMYKEDQGSQLYIDQLFSNETSDEAILLYKDKIHKSFFSNSARFNINKAKDYLEEALDICQDQHQIADLLLYYVECALELLCEDDKYWEEFYQQLLLVFAQFSDYIKNNGLVNEYTERVEAILVLLTKHTIDHRFKEKLYQLCLAVLRKPASK